MNENQSNNHTEDRVSSFLEKIKKDKIKIHSKTYYSLRLFSLVLVIIGIFVVSSLLFSFILFSVRASGQQSLIGFGPHGFQLFLILFPWKLFILDIILIVLLGWFFRSFKFGYRSPLLYLLIVLFLIMIGAGLLLDRGVHAHERFIRRGGDKHLPAPFGGMYEHIRRPPPPGYDIYRGIISATSTGSLIVNLDNEPSISTTTATAVILPADFSSESYSPGDRIFVFGHMTNGEIHAIKIKKIEEQELFFERSGGYH